MNVQPVRNADFATPHRLHAQEVVRGVGDTRAKPSPSSPARDPANLEASLACLTVFEQARSQTARRAADPKGEVTTSHRVA